MKKRSMMYDALCKAVKASANFEQALKESMNLVTEHNLNMSKMEEGKSSILYKSKEQLKTEYVLIEVLKERIRQNKLWGEQDHRSTDWLPILIEEVGEVGKAMYEKDWSGYREELIHVAAVAVSMIESYDRNST